MRECPCWVDMWLSPARNYFALGKLSCAARSMWNDKRCNTICCCMSRWQKAISAVPQEGSHAFPSLKILWHLLYITYQSPRQKQSTHEVLIASPLFEVAKTPMSWLSTTLKSDPFLLWGGASRSHMRNHWIWVNIDGFSGRYSFTLEPDSHSSLDGIQAHPSCKLLIARKEAG